MDRFVQMAVFKAVVDHKSFTAAATLLEMSKSTVSRHVNALEERLGARLLNRTTRSVHPTETGLAYYERCVVVISEAEEADNEVSALSSEPIGRLRIASAPAFASNWLVGPVVDFMAQHPRVEIDLVLEDRKVDVIAEGIDVAVRISALATSDLVARRLGESRAYMCASPAYLAEHGRPQTPDDVAGHECVLRNLPGDSNWTLEGPNGAVRALPARGRLRSNESVALFRAVIAGAGIGVFPDFSLRPYLDSGELELVLPEWRSPALVVHALYPHRRLLSSKVRVFIDFLARRFDPVPWGCRHAVNSSPGLPQPSEGVVNG